MQGHHKCSRCSQTKADKETKTNSCPADKNQLAAWLVWVPTAVLFGYLARSACPPTDLSETDNGTNRQSNRMPEEQTGRTIDWQRKKQAEQETDRETHGQSKRLTKEQTGRPTDWQRNKQLISLLGFNDLSTTYSHLRTIGTNKQSKQNKTGTDRQSNSLTEEQTA